MWLPDEIPLNRQEMLRILRPLPSSLSISLTIDISPFDWRPHRHTQVRAHRACQGTVSDLGNPGVPRGGADARVPARRSFSNALALRLRRPGCATNVAPFDREPMGTGSHCRSMPSVAGAVSHPPRPQQPDRHRTSLQFSTSFSLPPCPGRDTPGSRVSSRRLKARAFRRGGSAERRSAWHRAQPRRDLPL